MENLYFTSNDKAARMASDIFAETGWETTPGEVQDNIEFQAMIDVDTWLRTGRTDHFSWSK